MKPSKITKEMDANRVCFPFVFSFELLSLAVKTVRMRVLVWLIINYTLFLVW